MRRCVVGVALARMVYRYERRSEEGKEWKLPRWYRRTFWRGGAIDRDGVTGTDGRSGSGGLQGLGKKGWLFGLKFGRRFPILPKRLHWREYIGDFKDGGDRGVMRFLA